MIRRLIAAVALLLLGAIDMGSAQAPAGQLPPVDPGAAFEVTSVKPNRTLEAARRLGFSGSGLNAANVTVKELLRAAYGVEGFQFDDQIVGGPGWIETERFDVVGRLAAGSEPPSPDRMFAMLRALLTDRFGLSVHTETRDLPVYALVAAGAPGTRAPRLKASVVNCDDFYANRPVTAEIRDACQLRVRPGQIVGATTMARLAQGLSPTLDRLVVDRTNLPGVFELGLQWTSDPAAGADAVSIFTALQEQLGLRLQSGRGPVPVLVVDRVDRPMPD